MKLWIASANADEVEYACQYYPIHGVITNPSIIAAEGPDWKHTVSRLNDIAGDLIHLQVISTAETDILRDFAEFRTLIDKKTLIAKLPMTRDTLKVVPVIKRMGYGVNITAVSTYAQAIVALEEDIDYLSVYVARVSDDGGDGLRLLHDIRNHVDKKGVSTQLIAASVRNVEQFEEVARVGADGVAAPASLLERVITSPLTDRSIQQFSADWGNVLQGV